MSTPARTRLHQRVIRLSVGEGVAHGFILHRAGRTPSPIAVLTAAMGAMTLAWLTIGSSVARADLTWSPGGSTSGQGLWSTAGVDNWVGSGGPVAWNQAQKGVFAGTGSYGAYVVNNIPVQAGLETATVDAPALLYTGGIGVTPGSLDPFQNIEFFAGLNLAGEAAPVYSLNLVGTPTFTTPTDGNLRNTVLMQGTGGLTKTGGGLLTLRNPFSTFEGNIVVAQGGLNSTANPPQVGTFTPGVTGVSVYDYFNKLNNYAPGGSLANAPQPSAFGRADMERSVTVNSGAYLVAQGVDSFGGANAPVTKITVNLDGGRFWNDFVGGLDGTLGGIDPTRPGNGQRGPVTSLGTLSLSNSGTLNGAWGWIGPTGTTSGFTSQLQPIASGSQAWLLRGSVTASGDATMDTKLLSRGFHGGMHLYDTPFVVTEGTLAVPGQFFNQASNNSNPASGFTKSGPGSMVISGNNWHSGTTTVAEGTLVSDGRKSPLKVSPTVVSGSSAKLEILTTQTMGGIAVNAGEAKLPSSTTITVSTPTLSVNEAGGGGRIDIGKGRISIAPGGISEADLRADLIAGRGTGSFTGATGIMTTAGGAGDAPTANIGYRVTPTSTLVAWAASGDADLDGRVTTADVNAILTSGRLNTGTPGSSWQQGDFDYDGLVTTADVNALLTGGLLNQGGYLPPTDPTPPVVVQNFSTDPGWEKFQNAVSESVPLQAYGYQETTPFGSAAGGGTIFRQGQSSDRMGSYYADTTSFSGVNGLSYSDTFSAKGNIYIANENFDGSLAIGFFNSTQVKGRTAAGEVGTTGATEGSPALSFVGIQLNEPNTGADGAFRSRLYWGQNNSESNQFNNSNAGNMRNVTSPTLNNSALVQNTLVPFEFEYVGGLNGSGILTGSINGVDMSLTIATPTYYGPWEFDAFGIGTGLGSGVNTALKTGIWLDDLVYGFGPLSSLPSISGAGPTIAPAAVPEPSTWVLLVTGAVAALRASRIGCRRRKA